MGVMTRRNGPRSPSSFPRVTAPSCWRNALPDLQDKTDYPSFETVVVDNGSTAPDAIRLLQRIAAEPRTRVIQHPGPFNFSAMSNAGRAGDTGARPSVPQ